MKYGTYLYNRLLLQWTGLKGRREVVQNSEPEKRKVVRLPNKKVVKERTKWNPE